MLLLFGNPKSRFETVSTPLDVSSPTTLTFFVPDAKKGSYIVRLRVDGADSLPVILSGTPPSREFDPSQNVTIHMSDLSQWQESNDEYLSSALAWLRLAWKGSARERGSPDSYITRFSFQADQDRKDLLASADYGKPLS